jgi:hypothetical protein
MLKSRRGHIWDKSSHEVKTAEFMPRLDEFIGNRVHIDQLALKLELGTVYDLVYRSLFDGSSRESIRLAYAK